jgi:hypothetical protein
MKTDQYGVGDTNMKIKTNKENIMLTIIILLALVVVFDLVALRWSVDTTDSITSREWDRRWHRFDDAHDQLSCC